MNFESCFLCQNCNKKKKHNKRGFNRHQSAEHGDYTITYKERIPLNTFEQFVTISKVKLANDQCFESFMREFFIDEEFLTVNNILIDKECINMFTS